MAVTPFPIGIPADVNLNDVRSRAKALLRSAQAGERAALERIKPYFEDSSSLTLQRVQLVIAREHGFSSWHKLKAFVDARDELAVHQRKQESVPLPQERADGQSEWQRSVRELWRLIGVVAATLDAPVGDPHAARCTFCFQAHDKSNKLIAGNANFICHRCLDQCATLMQASPGISAADDRDYLPCSFCKKSATQVDSIVTASNSSICNECLDLCQQIVAGNPPPRNDQQP